MEGSAEGPTGFWQVLKSFWEGLWEILEQDQERLESSGEVREGFRVGQHMASLLLGLSLI